MGDIQKERSAGKPHGLRLACFIWVFVVLVLTGVSSATASFNQQLYLSGGLLAVLLIFKAVNPAVRGARLVFLGIATFIALRYLLWRTLYTVEFTDWLSFSCALILYVAELYGIAIFLIGNIVNISPITRKPAPLPDEVPTVDVLIPSYNESEEILEVTLMAATQMHYPADKMRVYLCDDGGTDQKCQSGSEESRLAAQKRRASLQQLCEDLGATYLTRPENRAAKAGNINEAFQKTDGDLVVIFDADHVPTEDFLQKTVGLFAQDEKLFLVQTPHFFTNPDPIEKNLDTFHQMPSESEMFYRVIQKGLDFWNAAFFCGSGAVMRRAHLQKVGGLAGDTITEDAETALTLHARGYNSAYISTPLLSGLSPETLGGFIRQRMRWAQGMIQIFLLKCPLFLRGLKLPQRICYFNSCLFWLFPFSRIIYLLAPAAFLLFGLKIYAANWETFCAYVVPYVIAVLSVSNYLYGKVRWAFISELYELLQSVYTLPAILSTILNPRAPTFNVTPKGEHLSRDFISPLARPFYFLAALNFATVGFGAWRLTQVASRDDFYPIAITLFWGVFNSVLLLGALGALLERKQRRATARMPANIPAELMLGERSVACRITDLSLGGCKLAVLGVSERLVEQYPQVKMRVNVGDDSEKTTLHLTIRNIRDDEEDETLAVGAEFTPLDVAEKRAKVRLATGSSARWEDFQKRRESKLGVFASFLCLTYLGLKYSSSHFGHLLLEIGGAITGRNRKMETQTLQG